MDGEQKNYLKFKFFISTTIIIYFLSPILPRILNECRKRKGKILISFHFVEKKNDWKSSDHCSKSQPKKKLKQNFSLKNKKSEKWNYFFLRRKTNSFDYRLIKHTKRKRVMNEWAILKEKIICKTLVVIEWMTLIYYYYIISVGDLYISTTITA